MARHLLPHDIALPALLEKVQRFNEHVESFGAPELVWFEVRDASTNPSVALCVRFEDGDVLTLTQEEAPQ